MVQTKLHLHSNYSLLSWAVVLLVVHCSLPWKQCGCLSSVCFPLQIRSYTKTPWILFTIFFSFFSKKVFLSFSLSSPPSPLPSVLSLSFLHPHSLIKNLSLPITTWTFILSVPPLVVFRWIPKVILTHNPSDPPFPRLSLSLVMWPNGRWGFQAGRLVKLEHWYLEKIHQEIFTSMTN